MQKIRTLNIGCGKDSWGTHRIDLYKTPITTHVVNVDKQKLPFPNNYFNEVRILGALEHFKNLGFVIDEVYRVMKKDAKLWIRTNHAGFIFFHIAKKMEHSEITRRWYKIDYFGHNQGDDHHFHLFVESHLKALLKNFRNVKTKFFYMNPNSWKGKLLRMLPRNLGASQIDLWAIK